MKRLRRFFRRRIPLTGIALFGNCGVLAGIITNYTLCKLVLLFASPLLLRWRRLQDIAERRGRQLRHDPAADAGVAGEVALREIHDQLLRRRRVLRPCAEAPVPEARVV